MRTPVLLLVITAVCFALSPAEEAKVKEVAREYIKDHLKAPATAIFSKETLCAPLGKPDFEEAKGTGPTPECKPQTAAKVGDRGDAVVYRASVDAQNSFGALIRSKFQLRVSFVQEKWSVIDSAESVRLSKQTCTDFNTSVVVLGQGTLRDCDAEYPNAK